MSANPEPLAASGIDADIAGKRLLILGAGMWGVEYLRRARLLGAETWATDWSPDAVGRHEAHHSDFTDDRRFLWASGLDTSQLFVFDVHTDPAKPRLVKTIDDFVAKTGVDAWLTAFPGPGGASP